MKKIYFPFIVMIIIIACEHQPSVKSPKTATEIKEIVVESHPNIETIGIILDLSDLGDYILDHSSKECTWVKIYRREFQAFKNHPAVLKANLLGELNLLHFNHYYYGLSYSDLPDFQLVESRYEEFYSSRTLSRDSIKMHLAEFDSLIRQFYVDAKMEQFLKKSEPYRSRIEQEVQSTLPNHIISAMENYYGEYSNQYLICPSSTIFSGFNFGPKVTIDGQQIYYYLTGPAYDLDTNLMTREEISIKEPLGFDDPVHITEEAIHEFGHSFLRFMDREDYRAMVDSLAYLNTEELKNNLEMIGEGTEWSTGFEEHLVRASEVMIWRAMGDSTKASKKLEYEQEEEGLLYISFFVESLENYQQQRKRFLNLEAFFPELIKDLSQIQISKPVSLK